MRIRDWVVLAVVLLWIAMVLFFLYKKKKSGRCIGCSGGSCEVCKKKNGNP